MYHNPVLLIPTVSALVTNPDGIYVDVTFGGGGHSREILNRLSDKGKLLAFDQDSDAQRNLIDDPRFQFIPYNFKYLKKFLQFYQAYPVDGILADLGVSSHQFNEPERGFSYRFDTQLDMRMNREKGLSADELINHYSLQQLTTIFREYGELANAKKVAFAIVKYRELERINSTADLMKAIEPILPHGKENKIAAQIFQAIRIEVNQEIEALKEFLPQIADALKPKGRIAIIAYHSLEDRLAKNYLKTGNLTGELTKDFYGNPLTPFALITRKAMQPTEEEIAQNPRARSAKLRIAEKL